MYTLNHNTYAQIPNSNISHYVHINEKMDLLNLTKICISGQNMNAIDMDLDLPNLHEFDISYNQLREFPNLKGMKRVKILNISFNNIKSVHVERVFPALEDLDISWNCLANCLATIETFKAFMPNMCKLKTCNNPFEDVLDPELENYLIHTYLPDLQFINNYACESLSMHQHYFPCAFNMCKLKQHNKLFCLKQNMVQNEQKVAVVEKKNIEHIKYIHISQNFLVTIKTLKRILKVKEFCATYCLLTTFPIMRPLKYLTKLNLGSNFISVLDNFTQESFPSLKYLDLTNNLITSLEPMGPFHTLQEFYCGNNEIKGITQIDNVKTWHMLHVIDLSNNPISSDALYKNFIIFHLSNIKVSKIINTLQSVLHFL